MEFFRIINKQVTESDLQKNIYPENIEKFADSMFYIEAKNHDFLGGTIWGEFLMSYSKINGGVRFTLLSCPNAFAWTITTGFPPDKDKIVLHCTINRIQISTEFIEEINEFLDEWETGLANQF
ncbi:hypothetical protein [Lutibacter sp.]|uniref:hypothetical protein n=1 Tax=Lutibacter sp. TaxID=1925666 RepID=UPI0025B8F148|nr:hypothetical protein [Lutibacter sp.]MCF6182521.1 hypothetical protein [Lutibacter sp.]